MQEDIKETDNLSKKDEIALLKELIKADGYFAEYFRQDLEQMVYNITNDFPIVFDTKFFSAAEDEKQHAKELVINHKTELYDLYGIILCAISENDNECLYKQIVEKIGLKDTIRLKHKLELPLSSKEIEFLVSQLN